MTQKTKQTEVKELEVVEEQNLLGCCIAETEKRGEKYKAPLVKVEVQVEMLIAKMCCGGPAWAVAEKFTVAFQVSRGAELVFEKVSKPPKTTGQKAVRMTKMGDY